MLHDQEENVPKQVVVLRKLFGPLEIFKVPIIPVALNMPIWIGQSGVETPDQSDGLMKVLDAERGRARLSGIPWLGQSPVRDPLARAVPCSTSTQGSPGLGSPLFYINSWAMIWPVDYNKDAC